MCEIGSNQKKKHNLNRGAKLRFYVGTSKVCEASIGEVQGEGLLSVSLEETVLMHSQWGFDSGFYLVIASAILAIIFFFLEIKDFVKQGR